MRPCARSGRRSALLAALALWCAAAPPARAEELLVDGIAAQVGGDIVLVSEVMRVIAPNERRMRAAGAPEEEIAKLRAEGLETMIEWRLIEKLVRDADLGASDAEVDETIAAIARENGISVGQLEKSVATQDMTFADYKDQIKRELERRKVVNAMVAARVHVEEAEIKKAYETRFAKQPTGGSQVHLRQILVPASEELKRTLEESCTLVSQLRTRIAAGESFEALAREHSATAPLEGGDIGWLHQDTLAGWMVRAIGDLEPGGVSPLIELPFGCTVVQVVERRAWEPVSYEQAKQALQAEVFEAKLAEEYRSWMDDLRERTFIERRGYFAEAANLRSTARAPEGGEAAAP
jgi:peptidyl-prolyl cis-trans isomerase SurA